MEGRFSHAARLVAQAMTCDWKRCGSRTLTLGCQFRIGSGARLRGRFVGPRPFWKTLFPFGGSHLFSTWATTPCRSWNVCDGRHLAAAQDDAWSTEAKSGVPRYDGEVSSFEASGRAPRPGVASRSSFSRPPCRRRWRERSPESPAELPVPDRGTKGGVLSRQHGESIPSYVLRRKDWTGTTSCLTWTAASNFQKRLTNITELWHQQRPPTADSSCCTW